MSKLDYRSNNEIENKYYKHKVYLEHRKLLIDAERESIGSFDRAILTLSGSAFGLSFTFIRQIVPNVNLGTIWMLICSWACFCMSLLLTLTSLYLSSLACKRAREILDEKYCSSNQNVEVNCENKPAIWTNWLNRFSIGFFISGAFLLAFFVIFNLEFNINIVGGR